MEVDEGKGTGKNEWKWMRVVASGSLFRVTLDGLFYCDVFCFLLPRMFQSCPMGVLKEATVNFLPLTSGTGETVLPLLADLVKKLLSWS